jgi:hypothetical protein
MMRAAWLLMSAAALLALATGECASFGASAPDSVAKPPAKHSPLCTLEVHGRGVKAWLQDPQDRIAYSAEDSTSNAIPGVVVDNIDNHWLRTFGLGLGSRGPWRLRTEATDSVMVVILAWREVGAERKTFLRLAAGQSAQWRVTCTDSGAVFVRDSVGISAEGRRRRPER